MSPSKLTHYFGALAGVFAAFLVTAIPLLLRCAQPVGHARPDTPGRAASAVRVLGSRTPPHPLRHEPSYQLWRAIGVPASHIPTGANRVRIHAVDATSDPQGWLAVSGPRSGLALAQAPVSVLEAPQRYSALSASHHRPHDRR